MKPEQRQQPDKLFHSALEREPAQRRTFLAKACAGDHSLRRQVEALLATHEEAGTFIEPAMEVEVRGLAADEGKTAAEFARGESFSHYRIIAPLGAGGMGQVYLAQDMALGRRVALKLLPPDFMRDRDRVRRFQQEARAASALNHPNIITILEIGQADDRHFIASEFIDGETLRQHVRGPQTQATSDSRSGPALKLRDILNIAIQTADALASAHEAGVVHRDIKPENIMVRRRDGYVKVLDFGLAKLTEGRSATVDTEAPTKAQVETCAGLIMGTASYMSPEQVRGLAVDVRTDIWSLGVVVYEMVAGKAPFVGDTTSDLIAAVLERQPPLLKHSAPEAPAELQRIVAKALRKDREERYQGVKDMLVDFKSVRRELEIEAELKEAWPQQSSGDTGGVKSSEQTTVGTMASPVPQNNHAEAPQQTWGSQYLVRKISRRRILAGIAVASLLVATVVGFALYESFVQVRVRTTSSHPSKPQRSLN